MKNEHYEAMINAAIQAIYTEIGNLDAMNVDGIELTQASIEIIKNLKMLNFN